MRFNFIEKVCENCVVKPKESKERIRSEKIDRILTGKYTAIPCFIGIMLAVFYLTFNVIGAGLQKLLEMGIDALTGSGGKASHCSKCKCGGQEPCYGRNNLQEWEVCSASFQ